MEQLIQLNDHQEATRKQRHETQQPTGLVCVNIRELLALDLPPMEPMFGPWLVKQSLSMMYAWRGVGKTYFALNIAYAVAAGGTFLDWEAPEPNGVLYVDGEMPGPAMQSRLKSIIKGSDKACDPEYFRIVTPDLQTRPMPDLSTVEGQELVEAQITDNTRLIVVDNLSSLVRSGKENDAESWGVIGEWGSRQRAQGRAVLFVHHSGKDGQQRGTSRREDILDTVVRLSLPDDYNADTDGARFNVTFEKDRHHSGAKSLEASLEIDDEGRQIWTTRSPQPGREDQIIALANQGASVTDIARKVGINKSNVSRSLQKAQSEGRYQPPPQNKGTKAGAAGTQTSESSNEDD